MFDIVEESVVVGRDTITIENGRLARQASGSVLVTCGGTQVLVATTAAREAKEDMGFFPLSVDYTEKFYAAGRFPGGYIKRENRPSDREILAGRILDRTIRPLFPESFLVETQVVATVVSVDSAVSPIHLAILGASSALGISDIPFAGPVAGVRVALIDGEFVLNPSEVTELPKSELDLFVSGNKDDILMVEAAANFLPEEKILEAIAFAQKAIKVLCVAQEALIKKCGTKKREVAAVVLDKDLKAAFTKAYAKELKEAYTTSDKAERKERLSALKAAAQAALVPEGEKDKIKALKAIFEDLEYSTLRANILKDDRRVDGRTHKDIRNIDCQVGVLKRTHGSALFTRGETQSLGVVTLGTSDDAQKGESIYNAAEERPFVLHYNMPGYSVGEVKRMMAPARREIGHGYLAQKALTPAIPASNRFPYVIRVVSEITESNGSSSMASVCSGTMALLHAGVPLKEPVAGIAMGLIKDGADYSVLSDILGDEDNLGDMDFKVAGSKRGVTAMQMDMKITGISLAIITEAVHQAKEGRLHILEKMLHTISKPAELSTFAPRIEQIKIKADKIRDLIGPGGKNIRKVVADTGCKVDVNDEGIVNLASTNGQAAAKARRMIQYLTTDPEIGEVYLGVVKKTTDFGAFVEIKPGIEGLVHISQLSHDRVNKTEDAVKEGEEILVKIIELDRMGRIKLSRKEAVGKTPSYELSSLLA